MESSDMRQTKLHLSELPGVHFSKLAVLAIFLAACCSIPSSAQQKNPKSFSTPEQAADALFNATQSKDEGAMLDILGAAGKQIVSSGDEVEDADNQANFARRYQEMHRLVTEPNGTIMLYIGAENWPTPIPLVHKGSAWYFDTAAGKKEILYRRIGRNEVSTMKVCQELVAAQKEYYASQHHQYAANIFSDAGQHNGLYWKAAEGEPQSPIGPLVAAANAEGYSKGDVGPPTPYRGYYFRVLTRQGKDASGGSKDFIADGKMTGGFAFVAYPAEYRSSGVMTFIVGEDGVVYEKDLGKNTEVLAKSMKEYDPNSTWQKPSDLQDETATDQKPN
jgi:hypothetical protein